MEEPKKINQITIGDSYQTTVRVTDEMVRAFAQATGDTNPVHLDEEFAKTSIFKGRVAHGMLTAGLLSMVFGTRFPGLGTIYLSQFMQFLKPVYLNDEITIKIKVLEAIAEKNRIRAETVCLNQKGKEILKGEAWVMPPA